MKGFEIGDRVRLVDRQVYKGSYQDYLAIGGISVITELGDAGSFGDYYMQQLHVKVKEEGTDVVSWVQITCLEPVNDDEAIKEALESIQQAGVGTLNDSLQFDEIVFRDSLGNKFILRPHRDHMILFTNEKGEFEILLDRRLWNNTAQLVELALNAAEA